VVLEMYGQLFGGGDGDAGWIRSCCGGVLTPVTMALVSCFRDAQATRTRQLPAHGNSAEPIHFTPGSSPRSLMVVAIPSTCSMYTVPG